MLKSSKGYPLDCKKPSVVRFMSVSYKNLHMALKIPEILWGGQCSEAAHGDLWVSNTLRSCLILSRNPYRALCCLGQPRITGSCHSKLDEENHRKAGLKCWNTFLHSVPVRLLSEQFTVFHDHRTYGVYPSGLWWTIRAIFPNLLTIFYVRRGPIDICINTSHIRELCNADAAISRDLQTKISELHEISFTCFISKIDIVLLTWRRRLQPHSELKAPLISWADRKWLISLHGQFSKNLAISG
jgi:hypothetical protein